VTGVANQTSQVYGNKINVQGDAPALNRGAQGAGGQPPSYEDAVKICETLTDKELDFLIISGHPLGQVCLDMEIIDEAVEEQIKAEERIEEEIRKAIEEADYEKVKAREDAWALAEVM
jgi:hypothetical protein